MVEFKLSVTGHHELAELGRRLKEAGDKELTKELRKGLKKAADPGVRKTQAAIRSLPIRGEGTRGGGKSAREIHQQRKNSNRRNLRSAGLRETIARGIKAKISAGAMAHVQIKTSAAELPRDQHKLIKYLDSDAGWRHPVFGDKSTWLSLRKGQSSRVAKLWRRLTGRGPREVWVRQYGAPWFGATLKKEGPSVRKEVLEAMRDVAGKIAKG